MQIPEGAPYASNLVGCGLSVANPVLRTGCNYLMACTRGGDLEFRTISGELLKKFDTKSVYNTGAVASPDGKLVAVHGYLGPVQLYLVKAKGGAFGEVIRVADLGGHTKEVDGVAFSPDSRVRCVPR